MGDSTNLSSRNQYEILRGQLELERGTFIAHWRDISDFVLPRRARFFVSDANKGDRRNQKIIDSTATLALRTLRAGMMSGVTSPARPWFRLSTPDPGMSEFTPIKMWLDDVSQRMATVFLKSNLYNSLPILYGDLGCFATGAMFIEEDLEDVIRTYPFPIGSYMIANNDKLRVDVLMREFRMTVRQLVQKFGKKTPSGAPDWSIFSQTVKNHWDRGNYETWIDVVHAIQPNIEFDPKKLNAEYKRYSSVYYERGYYGRDASASYMSNEGNKFLSKSGYDYFPALCPRWETSGEDVYGTSCPGMDSLGDIKQLQTEQKRKAQAIEKMVNPPMTGPTSLKNAKASILPGDITFVDEREGQKGFRPAHLVDPRIRELMEDIQDVRRSISRAFYEDLFLMLAQSDRREITAREIDERHEEKLLALGPVLEQLNQDALDPLIDITFNKMQAQGLIPPPPKELEGQPLKVEYISIMAQAQKLVGISGIERFAGFAGNMLQVSGNPAVADKVDFDQLLDEHGEAVGVPPGVIRSDEAVEEIRAVRAKKEQAQQQNEEIAMGAKAAKDLSGAKLDEDNVLSKLAKGATGG